MKINNFTDLGNSAWRSLALFEGESPSCFDPEQQKYIAAARRAQLDERMASIVNGAIKINSNIDIGFGPCGKVGAFFSPQRQAIVICSKFVEMIGKTAFNDKAFMMKLPKEQFARAIDGLL